jgi:hypothetical protein
MTTPLKKPDLSLVSFEFRVSGFEFEKSSTINPPSSCGDVVARAMFARLASETFLRGLQKKLIETP